MPRNRHMAVVKHGNKERRDEVELQHALGAGHARDPRVRLQGGAQCAGGRFKDSLGNMMTVAAVVDENVHIA